MNIRFHPLPRAAVLAALLLALTTAAADDRRGGHHRGYYGGHHGGHYDYDSFAWGLSLGYPPPYWSAYGPAYGYYPGYAYPPAYPPGLGGSISLGYSSWGYDDNLGLSLSLPLYVGPRYAPPPAPVLVPAPQPASRQPPAGCLQAREYQTEIVIDGQAAPAWGQACLQADGSWKIISGPFTR
jgi:hypothetical protein